MKNTLVLPLPLLKIPTIDFDTSSVSMHTLSPLSLTPGWG